MKIAGHEVAVLSNNSANVGCSTVTLGELQSLLEEIGKYSARRPFAVNDFVRVAADFKVPGYYGIKPGHGDCGKIVEIKEEYAKFASAGPYGVEFAHKVCDYNNCGLRDKHGYWFKGTEIEHVDDYGPVSSVLIVGGNSVSVVSSYSAKVGQALVTKAEIEALIEAIKQHKATFAVGDFVRVVDAGVLECHGDKRMLGGQHGKVVSVGGGLIGVEFAAYDQRLHRCDSSTKKGHGWYVHSNDLVKVD